MENKLMFVSDLEERQSVGLHYHVYNTMGFFNLLNVTTPYRETAYMEFVHAIHLVYDASGMMPILWVENVAIYKDGDWITWHRCDNPNCDWARDSNIYYNRRLITSPF